MQLSYGFFQTLDLIGWPFRLSLILNLGWLAVACIVEFDRVVWPGKKLAPILQASLRIGGQQPGNLSNLVVAQKDVR